MKVLLTADCVGGVWTYALDLADALADHGHEVVLAVMGAELVEDQRTQLARSRLAAWEARPYRLEWMADADGDLADARAWLLQLAQRHEPHVVHLNQFNFAELPWPCPVLLAAHSDVVTWWRAVHGSDPPPEWDRYRERVGRGLRKADAVVAPTHAMLRDLQAAYAFDTPARVIANGRNLGVRPIDKEPLLAAVGRVWDKAKNVAAAVRAAEGLPWPLMVAGPGEPTGTATFLGRVSGDEAAGLLARASIFVAPARYEPFGLAALEAGMLGCALVVGDIPSLREVWGDAATFVDPDDEAGLRAAVEGLITDPQRLDDRRQAAAATAWRYRVEHMAAAYAEAYADVTAAVSSGRGVA